MKYVHVTKYKCFEMISYHNKYQWTLKLDFVKLNVIVLKSSGNV